MKTTQAGIADERLHERSRLPQSFCETFNSVRRLKQQSIACKKFTAANVVHRSKTLGLRLEPFGKFGTSSRGVLCDGRIHHDQRGAKVARKGPLELCFVFSPIKI